MLKSYTVTFRGSPTERLSPYALDEVKGLDNALTHALNLIRAGHQDVAIQDGTGKKWELYNIAEDYSENNDLAAKMPDKLRDMQELFMVEAQKYQVFLLDNSVLQRVIAPRPSSTAGRTTFTYSGELPGIPYSDAPDVLNTS